MEQDLPPLRSIEDSDGCRLEDTDTEMGHGEIDREEMESEKMNILAVLRKRKVRRQPRRMKLLAVYQTIEDGLDSQSGPSPYCQRLSIR
jgi:hypothetical protein